MNTTELQENEFALFQKYIYESAGIKVPDAKRTLVSNRIRRRLKATGQPTFKEYYTYLTSPTGKDELPSFLDEITTNETYFFRDEAHYAWLRETLVKEWRQKAGATLTKPLRVWSAACSSGEEPYSMAIALTEGTSLGQNVRIDILATDLSQQILTQAKTGEYNARSLRLVSPELLKRHFKVVKEGELWQVGDKIKRLVHFKHHNLMQPLKETGFDVVFIKNVLIYFDMESKKVVVENLIKAIAPGGFLVVGPSEGIFTMLGSLERVNSWLYRKPAKPN